MPILNNKQPTQPVLQPPIVQSPAPTPVQATPVQAAPIQTSQPPTPPTVGIDEKVPFWKKPIFLLVVGIVLVVLTLVILFWPSKEELVVEEVKKTSEIPLHSPFQTQNEVSQASQRKKANLKFVGTVPDIPKYLDIYQLQIADQTLPENAVFSIASNLGFSGNPTMLEDAAIGTVYIWYGTTHNLVIRPTLREVSYSVNELPSEVTAVHDLDYELIAQTFLDNAGLLSNLIINPKKTSSWEPTDTTAVTNLMKVVFEYSISGVPLVGHYFGESPVILKIDNSGYVVDMNYISLDVSQLTKVGTYSVKTVEQALNVVESGVGFLVYVEESLLGFEEVEESDGEIKGTLTEVYLAYYQPGDGAGTLQPVFVFKGNGSVGEISNREFTLYVPALQSDQ